MTATAQATATARPNRFPGPCSDCGIHVRATYGELHGRKGAYGIRCQDCTYRMSLAPSGGSGDSDAASNGPPESAPAGDAPRCSERAAMAAIALVRHAVDDKRGPPEALDILIELATLAVWRCGSAEAARDLAGALPRQTSPEHDAAAVDLVGEILGRARVVSDADAERTADELAGPRVDSPVARAYVGRSVDFGTVDVAMPIGRATVVKPAAKPSKAKASRRGGNPFAHRTKQ